MSTTEDQIPWVRLDQPKPAKPAKPKAKPRAKPKGFLEQLGHNLKNSAEYELKRLRQDPLKYAAQAAPRAARAQFGPGISPVVGALSDANRMGYSFYQRQAQKKQRADPSRGGYGAFIDNTEEALYRFAGMTPPAEMTGKQRGEDSFIRQAVPYLFTAPIGGALFGVGKAATAAGAIVRGGGAGIVADLLAGAVTDNRGGNVINMANDLTGAKLPGAVNVGRDDMVDSALKSVVPNAAVGAVIGAGIDIGIHKFPATMRWLRGNRAVEEVKASRGRTVATGLQEQAEDGTYRFKPITKEEAQTMTPADVNKRLDEWVNAGESPTPQPKPAEPVAAPEPAPKAPATEADTQALDDLPDSTADLPEIDAVEQTVRQLDDEELLQAAGTFEPVVDTVNNLLDERVPVEPDPNLRMDLVSAPTANLSDSYLNGIGAMDPWEQLIEGAPINRLRMVAANSPDYSEKIQSMTGRGPDEWTRDDLVDGAKAMSQQGRTVITSRIRGNQEWVPTGDLKTNPDVFQYKGGVNAAGEQAGSSLGDVQKWDPTSEGVLLGWKDPQGQGWVVNGHNRHGLAGRKGIPSLPVKWSEASTAAGARMEGAIQNINDGKGTAFDAAKFIRDSGITDEQQLVAAGMPLESGWGKQGLALSRLPEDVFQGVVQDESLLRKAVLVGESGLPPEGMRGAFKLLKEKPGLKEGIFRELLAQKVAGPKIEASAKQGDILAGTEWDIAIDETMLTRAELADKLGSLLKKRKRVFSNAGNNADQLQAAGNTIDKAGAQAISTDAERTFRLFDQLKYQSGPVADLLNKGVQQVMDGGKIDAIARQLDEQLGPQLELGVLNSTPPMEAPAAAAVSPDQMELPPGWTSFRDGPSTIAEYKSGPFVAETDMDVDGTLFGELHFDDINELPQDFLASQGVASLSEVSTQRKASLARDFASQEIRKLPPGRYELSGDPRRNRIWERWFAGKEGFTKNPDGSLTFTKPKPAAAVDPNQGDMSGAPAEQIPPSSAPVEDAALPPEWRVADDGSIGGYQNGPFMAEAEPRGDGTWDGDVHFSDPSLIPKDFLVSRGVQDVERLSLPKKTSLIRDFAKQEMGKLPPGSYLLNSDDQRNRIYQKWFLKEEGFTQNPDGSLTFTKPKPAAAVDPNQGDMFGAPAEMPPIELTAGERESIRTGMLQRAIADGEVRPSATPEPELPPQPLVSLEEARADAAARGGIAPGSPAAQGVADEYRLQKTFEREDNLLRQDQEDALRDAYGYGDATFEEKKKLGMLEGWEDEPVQVQAAEPGAPDVLIPPPPRPVPVRISQAPPFDGVPVVKAGQFTPPEKLKPGRADLMAPALANRLGVTRDEAAALIRAKGQINYDKVMGGDEYLKASDLEEMGRLEGGALQLRNIARQFYGLPEFRVGADIKPPPSKASSLRAEKQIKENNAKMDEIRRKAQEEGC